MRVASALSLCLAATLAWLIHGSAHAGPTEAAAAPAVVPPRLLTNNHDLSNCYPLASAMYGREGRVVAEVTVGRDGSVAGFRLPPGTESWQERAARCVLGYLRFAPATRDGKPVDATATVPIVLGIRGSSGSVPEFDAPTIRSNAAAVEAIYRDCYPAGMTVVQRPLLKFTVGVDGRARNVRLLQSGGDTRLDQAGKCIVRKLVFQPLLRGSQAVKSTVSWPIHVGPPGTRPSG